jgi:4-amino-4-deoxy-L-arabinose transferase-like glycosyltransferase
LCPLLFVEFLRFENQLYSFCLAFASLGLYLTSQNSSKKVTWLILCVITALIALSLWTASILVLFLIVLVTELPKKYQTGLLVLGIAIGTIIYWKYMFNSFKMILFQPMNLIGEEIPLIGLVFIIHLITFVKYVPRKYLPYTIILWFIGLVKVKFLFLATPFLSIGLIKKDLLMGIFIGKDKLNLYPIAIIGLCGMIVLSFFLYPTQANVLEVQQAIKLAEDNNLELRNDWGDGWLVTWQGKYTPYKISNNANPDLNGKGFVAYTNKDLNECKKINTKTYLC